MKTKIVSFEKLKGLLDRDSSLKYKGRFFYNNKVAYTCDNSEDMNASYRYYFTLENRTKKIHSEKLIKKLIWNKKAEVREGKILYNDIIYDGGEFAKEEHKKYFEAWKKRRTEEHRDHLFSMHNNLLNKKVNEVLNDYEVKITREAKEKAHKIAERMVHLTGPNEIYLEGANFINKKDNPAIRDVYIADGQIATRGACGRILSDDTDLTTKTLDEQGKYRIAWMHSHANMPTFHSSIDDGNLNLKTGRFGKDIDIEISVWGWKSKTKLKVYPSLVFNALKSKPYVEVGAKCWSVGLLGKSDLKYFSRKNVPLEILPERNNIDLSSRTIDKEINKRVLWWPGKNVSKDLEKILERRYGIDFSRPRSFLELKRRDKTSPKVYEKEPNSVSV